MIGRDELADAVRTSVRAPSRFPGANLLALGLDPQAAADQSGSIATALEQAKLPVGVMVRFAFTAGLEVGIRLGRRYPKGDL